MNSLRRPSLSDIRPKTSAPITSPTRYTVPIEAASVVDRASVSTWVSLLLTELAIVTDRPSRTHAVPRPRTSRVWNGDQRRRSSRAGIVLRIGWGPVVATSVIRDSPRALPRRHADQGRPTGCKAEPELAISPDVPGTLSARRRGPYPPTT